MFTNHAGLDASSFSFPRSGKQCLAPRVCDPFRRDVLPGKSYANALEAVLEICPVLLPLQGLAGERD